MYAYLAAHTTVVKHRCSQVQQTLGMTPRSSRFSTCPGMRLEARDRLNPHMMCVARISGVEGSSMLIAFDGWSEKYDYWCSPDSDDMTTLLAGVTASAFNYSRRKVSSALLISILHSNLSYPESSNSARAARTSF